jgi:hypothetical protein
MVDENPYKGVKGGDPRLRAQHVKVVVPRDFVCAKCGKKKTEKFFEGKDLTGRVCVDCRNAEGVQKQKEQRAEAEKRWAENRRKARNAPIRTKEEKLALMKEWAHAPKEKCSMCGGTFFIANPAMPFYTDHYDRPNAIRMVTYTSDPYELEINHRDVEDWYCRACHDAIAWDI